MEVRSTYVTLEYCYFTFQKKFSKQLAEISSFINVKKRQQTISIYLGLWYLDYNLEPNLQNLQLRKPETIDRSIIFSSCT